MPGSFVLHAIAELLALAGLLVLVASWIVGLMAGSFFSLSQQHLYFDAITLLLFSIAIGIAAPYHQMEEKK